MIYFIIITLMIVMFILMILFSTLEFEIKKLNISNTDKKSNRDLIINVQLKIFKICWLKIKIDNKRLADLYVIQQKFKYKNNITLNTIRNNIKRDIINRKEVKKQIKNIRINLEYLNLNIRYGNEDYILTSYIVAIISVIISNILPHFNNIKKQSIDEINKKYKYKITPIYTNKKVFEIKFDCIINTKLGHIIYIIYLIKRRSDKDERASNRKSYEYGYE